MKPKHVTCGENEIVYKPLDGYPHPYCEHCGYFAALNLVEQENSNENDNRADETNPRTAE